MTGTTTLARAAEIAGVSYRQANHWVAKGYVKGTWLDRSGEEVSFGGSGYMLHLSYTEQLQLQWMARLELAGLQPSDRTAEIARSLAAGSAGVRLGESLVLMLDPNELQDLPDFSMRRLEVAR